MTDTVNFNQKTDAMTDFRLLTFYAFVFGLMVFPVSGKAQSSIANTIQTEAGQAIVVDFETGDVLFAKNADEQVPTSSMSKVITTYLVFDALKKGDLKLDDELYVSEKAWKMQGSKMWVPVGKKVKVEDLIRGVVIQSGNDATIVLAEGLAGTEEGFAVALNQKAQELGMKNSHFVNASGWPHDNHYSTVRDLALLSEKLIRNFPEYYHYYSEKEFTFSDIKQGNRNPLLYRDIGVDGIKTGHTEAAGYGLIASGTNDDGRRVIAVLNGMKDMQARADESAKLLLWGLNAFTNVSFFEDKRLVETAPVAMGQVDHVALYPQNSVTLTLPKIYEGDVKVEVSYKSPLVAPVKEGEQVGNLYIKVPDGEDVQVPLVAGASVKEKGFFGKIVDKAVLLISG